MSFNTDKYTSSPFMKGDDLEEGERTVVTIKTAEEVKFPSGDTVPILSFLEVEQKLTLNKTRVKKLVEFLGNDTDEWISKKIVLYRIDVQYNGKTIPGVAVAQPPRKPKPGAALAEPVRNPPPDNGGLDAGVQFMPEDKDDDGSH